MRCILTCAVMAGTDPELALAQGRLAERLAEIRRRLGGEEVTTAPQEGGPWRMTGWRYLASFPVREDDGTIVYAHFFRHDTLTLGDEPLSLAIPASVGWWPTGCRSLTPRRSAPRGDLRLVS